MDFSTVFIESAYDFAKKKHAGQVDDVGKPYFETHVVQVSMILKQITQDEQIIAAGLLHDTIEDTDTTYGELVGNFGARVIVGLIINYHQI